ncbi:hemopexin-like [Protopterus annectens]|uniref:hemopexin-like n=1 Tax=Protopterus annectens TaxID=7888 RepID=UPI001CFBB721|nr:hemopexin-like [Protopterus annectens]
MRDSLQALFLCCILGLAFPLPLQKSRANDTGGQDSETYGGVEPLGAPNRCEDEEGFDAATLDENGVMNFFKGDFVWKGGVSSAEYLSASYPGIRGPIDAACRIHSRHKLDVHNKVFLFKDSSAWMYSGGMLQDGYPKPIHELFPGIPDKLDAAVECPAGECLSDSVLFFKGGDVYVYDLITGKVKQKRWTTIPKCTAALRWLERDYCFNKIMFHRFTPVRGEIRPTYALDARNYFIRCPGRGHGKEAKKNATIMSIMDRCSNRSFDAFISDDLDRVYALRGNWYLSLHTHLDGWHAWPLREAWKELNGIINAAFYWDHKMYFIQGSQVYIYKADQSYTLIEGYPKPLQEELGIQDDNLDAAFSCPGSSLLYFIKGNKMRSVDLLNPMGTQGLKQTIPHTHTDAATCTPLGVFLFDGTVYYKYQDPAQLAAAKKLPEPHSISKDFMKCVN